MSTRSFIGQLEPNGKVKGIYCHWDGYPNGVGKILREHYTTPPVVTELVNIGGISSLHDHLEATRKEAYGDSDPLEYSSLIEFAENVWEDTGADYAYIFQDNNWTTYSRTDV